MSCLVHLLARLLLEAALSHSGESRSPLKTRRRVSPPVAGEHHLADPLDGAIDAPRGHSGCNSEPVRFDIDVGKETHKGELGEGRG